MGQAGNTWERYGRVYSPYVEPAEGEEGLSVAVKSPKEITFWAMFTAWKEACQRSRCCLPAPYSFPVLCDGLEGAGEWAPL
jgi:hypothetical protein